jgi:hypothetical protein
MARIPSPGHLTFNGGLRIDQYNGLSEKTGIEPRGGASYLLKKTGTVLRAGYSHTMETPYNENLLLSSASGVGGLATNVFGAYASAPLRPGTAQSIQHRFQQTSANTSWWTPNISGSSPTGLTISTCCSTRPSRFPFPGGSPSWMAWPARVSTTNFHGFQAFMNMGHTRARFFGPEDGGLIFNSPVDVGVFRIDHDQAYEQTMNLRYQRPTTAPWIDFTWRFDSGEVAGSVPDLAAALALTADEQSAIGFYCGSNYATIGNRITSCSRNLRRHPAGDSGGRDRERRSNPPRIAPHSILDVGIGDDNVLHTEKVKLTLKFVGAEPD